MLVLNEANGRYEAVVRGALVSVSAQRIADDAHNRASMAMDDRPYAERLAEKIAFILSNPEIYRAKHNGFSVQVTSNWRLRNGYERI